MGKYRNYDHNDVFYASTVDALMEATSTLVAGLRLTLSNTTTVKAAASSGSGQVGIALNGLWRWRTTDYTVAVSGSAGPYDIFVVCYPNDFTGGGSDPDATNYAWELQSKASGQVPSGGGISEYRKVGEVDWDGTKVTGLRQLAGLGDATGPVQPTAPTADIVPLRVRMASAQTASALTVEDSSGNVVASVSAAGAVAIPAAASLSIGDASLTKGAADTLVAEALDVTGALAAKGNVRLGDNDADTLGFFSVAGAARKTGYTVTGTPSDKAFNIASTSLNEVAEVLGSLINDLKAYGLIG